MTVIQKFCKQTKEAWWVWSHSLSSAEQQEFDQAELRQLQYRQEAIDQGLLTVHADGYYWKNDETFAQGKKFDPVWMKFWKRWVQLHHIDESYYTLERDTVLTIVQVAPQETEISSDVVGGTKQDVTENTLKVFSP